MAIVFAAILPHSPLLVPSIGGEQSAALASTLGAIQTAVTTLALAKLDALLVISCHQDTPLAGLVFNVRPEYTIDYEQFGDFRTKLIARGTVALANALKNPFDARRHELPVAVMSDEKLDYGCTTLLYHVLSALPDLPILPLNDTMAHPTHEYTYGQHLGPLVSEYPGRVGIIASANLSHRLSADSPAGFSSRAKAFDRRILDLIRISDAVRMTRIRAETIREVGACGLGPICLLLGMLHGIHYKTHELSYQAPFGIGLPSFLFELSANI